MPVTFEPAKHQCNALPLHPEWAEHPLATRILRIACPNQFNKCNEILQSSLDRGESDDGQNIIPFSNGFVKTVIRCYSGHHALIIRPDDVWLAILTQFNFFVNGNAEQLRKQFVSHEGKKELKIQAVGTRYTVDFGSMARTMKNLIDENIVDPTLREWIVPDFSTTTITDITVASIIMMATLKVSGLPNIHFSHFLKVLYGRSTSAIKRGFCVAYLVSPLKARKRTGRTFSRDWRNSKSMVMRLLRGTTSWCRSSQDSSGLLTIPTLMRTLSFGRGWLIMKEVVAARPGLLVG
jgi:hypothetical protein